MNYEHEMIESIGKTVEAAKERQPVRHDVYLCHIDYYQTKLEQNRYMIEEFNSLRNDINILTNSCLELLLKISNERGTK